ncbi:glutathione synthase [Rhizodiscina lignyota]|uniref:Glutathione synthetase n=1 Tax=Rhizodiscina lignyota TaxID=1504668 RepID=A0A9P4IFH2_9PEZI|nr:glutathione synthase [Rhizodiscina lignyota]
MTDEFYLLQPPRFSEEQLEFLIHNAKDYQITHGSLLKLVRAEEEHSVPTRPVGVSLVPSQFPRKCFEQGVRIQGIYNELYAKVASDEAWLAQALKDYIRDDPFTSILWEIYLESKRTNFSHRRISLGVFRSDYMIHLHKEQTSATHATRVDAELKQVEFNAFSCAGGTHANIVANMHQHLHKIGAYRTTFGNIDTSSSSLPPNDGINGIVRGLVSAHHAYYASNRNAPTRTGVLFIVQGRNFNICDERPLEYALWDQNTPIPAYRLIFGPDVIEQTSIGPSGELLFNSPTCPFSPLEISVVYMRAGYELEEYDDVGCAARLRLEGSRAVKCPSILSHITTFKKVQQELTKAGALERFIDESKCKDIRSTFAPLYPLDKSEQGLIGRKLALNPDTAGNHVLKPSLEGGGHNIYGRDIPNFLAETPEEIWHTFVLMEIIRSPTQSGMLMSPRGLYEGPVLSELGVLGTSLWSEGSEFEIMENDYVGWTFKSKAEDVNEMSVVKGYGCFDSPWLVDVP